MASSVYGGARRRREEAATSRRTEGSKWVGFPQERRRRRVRLKRGWAEAKEGDGFAMLRRDESLQNDRNAV
jgi:hypothetical protein